MSEMPFEHKMGAHCESGTVSSLLNHAGLEITEPMVFGIAGGIFFGYMNTPSFSFPTIILRNRPGQIRIKIAKRLGISFKTQKFRNQDAGIQALDNLLEQNIPTGAQVDFFYMKYIPEWQRVHINVHYITVIGKNSENYILSDSYYPKIAELDFELMRKGRFARGNMAPKGFLFYPEKIPENVPFEKAIVTGIKSACHNMLKLPVPFIGIKGIYRFADKIMEWPKLARDIEHLSHEIMKINILLEDQGTGGAGFRYMYATFLQQASVRLNNPALAEMSKRMMEIGDGWRNISYIAAKIGKKRELGESNLKELSNLIRERGDLEKVFFKDLLKAV
jgi:hypothetical protein